jgi:PST family polysaccharide transporter
MPDAVTDVIEPVPPVVEGEQPLGRAMGKGLAWSLLNNVIGRLGNFLSGIVVIRILSPEDYGVYAVGMVVLTVLLSMNELGVSVAIIQRKGEVDSIAPSVFTLSMLSSTAMALGGFLAAPYVASALSTPQATGLIRLLLVGVLIDGFTSVSNALITRAFEQRKRLIIDLLAFVSGTPLIIGLALAGDGAWSLGWGSVVGTAVGGIMAWYWAPKRYWFGWNREAAREVLKFGLPLAGSSVLLFVMLNVDYVVVGHVLGTVELGIYLLAFNLCSWPITVISSAIRRVTLAAFARMNEGEGGISDGFERTSGIVMALTLPICALLAAYSTQTIQFLYGDKWSGAGEVVRWLTVLSVGRVVVELAYDYLSAIGHSHSTLWLHGIWLVVLVPVLTIGAERYGLRGVGVGHALVVVAVVFPLVLLLVVRGGASVRKLFENLWLPTVGAGVILLSAIGVDRVVPGSLPQLLVGCTVGLLLYAAVILPMRHSARFMWNLSSAPSTSG